MPGDRTTLLPAFLTHRDALLRFLTRRLGNSALAEDLAQETWLRAARADGTVAVANPAGYLFRIAANLARDHRRHADHRVEVQAEESVVAAVADPGPSPEAAARHREELARLARAVDGLSPRCREVFILAKVEGLTYGAIAARLGIARTTVITHMVTALAAIERTLRDDAVAGTGQATTPPSFRPPARHGG